MPFSSLLNKRERGFFDGQFLIAMPGMSDDRFSRSVVFVCAHSSAGAMGFVINRPQNISFTEVLKHLNLGQEGEDQDTIRLASSIEDFPVRSGGPVENGRGFVLHSDDYTGKSTLPVSDDISLTATLDIIRSISKGQGPKKAALFLGYVGWGAGQLENEIASNGWLMCPATEKLIFDPCLQDKYDRALASMGVSLAMLSSQAGHA